MKKAFLTLSASIATSLIIIFTTATTNSVKAKNNYNQNQPTDVVSINIDGYFNDWDDKPKTDICYPWDIPPNGTHKASLLIDDQYVYLYIKMAKKYSSYQGYNYEFTVNGNQKVYLQFEYKGKPSKDPNVKLPIYGYLARENHKPISNEVDGIVLKQENQSDVAEMRIPVSVFVRDNTPLKSLVFYCTNLGPQCVTAVNTSTMPIVIAGIGAVIASSGYFITKKKKNKDKDKNTGDTE